MKRIYFITLFFLLLKGMLPAQTLICQPYYGDRTLRVYSSINPVAANPLFSANISQDINSNWSGLGCGPNAVAIHQGKVFVAIANDPGNAGGVLIYNWQDLFPTKSAGPLVVHKPANATTGLSCTGLAIQPSTGNLFIPTINSGNGDGGVYTTTPANNYSNAPTQFSSFNNDNSVAEICGNLAFDKAGNLWMSTFSPSNNAAQHFVICYENANKNTFYKITNTATKAYPATTMGGVDIATHLLSGPEGLTFDYLGNLIICNNNDFARANDPGQGTIVKVRASWVATLRAPGTYTVPVNQTEILHVPGAKFGGAFSVANLIYANDQGTNQGGDFATNGILWQCDMSKIAFSGMVPSGIKTTYPGNGQAALANPKGLLIKDNVGDVGFEPNTTQPAMWESMDIWVRLTSDGQANDISQEPEGGKPSFAYVRITNTGFQPSNGTEVVKLYWAKANSFLAWPAPWDAVLIGGAKYGAQVGAGIPLPVLQPGQTHIQQFTFVSPDPRSFGGDGHFCLLARIETQATPPFGMNVPELATNAYADLLTNVRNNSKIAWRNIHIRPGTGNIIPPSIIGLRNHGRTPIHMRLGFEIYDAKSNPIGLDKGSLRLHASGPNLDKFQNFDYNRELMVALDGGQFELNDLDKGFEHLTLQPEEALNIGVSFTPNQPMQGHYIRVSAYASTDEGEVLVGGQTFVEGKVELFQRNTIEGGPGVDEPPVDELPFWKRSCWLGWPCWVWILIGLGLLILVIIVVVARRKP